MTDEEALGVLPVVREFVKAVHDRDELTVEACFLHTDPRLLAAWCADMLIERTESERDLRGRLFAAERRADGLDIQCTKLSAAYADAKGRIKELRSYLDAQAGRKVA